MARSDLVEGLENELSSLQAEFGGMKTHYEDKLAVEKAKYKSLWSMYCSSSSRDDRLIAEKEEEVEKLCARLAEYEKRDRADRELPIHSHEHTPVRVPGSPRVGSPHTTEPEPVDISGPTISTDIRLRSTRLMPGWARLHTSEHTGHRSVVGTSPEDPVSPITHRSTPRSTLLDAGISSVATGLRTSHPSQPRRGKAPPIDTFSGDGSVSFEDWIPALERCSMWNAWSEEETLLQLAGHLRGRALEEWNLMEEGDRHDISKAK